VNAALVHDPPTVAEQAIATMARTHVPTFIDFVMRNSKSGARIESAPLHEEWHKLADRHPRLIIQSAIELGKTQQLVIGRALHFLGRDQNGSVLIVANTASQASQNLQLIAEYIEHSRELALVFPGLRPDRKAVWNSTALTVERTAPSRDPSVMAIGIHGNVLGARIDLMIIDDPCDAENSCTARGRDDISRWIDSTLLGRLTANARVIACGNPWHKDDLLARLGHRPGFVSKRYAVTNLLGRSRWPAQWPASRIAAKRIELQAREAARQLDCLAPDEVDAIFHSELIGRALALGENASTEFFASAAETGATVVVGIDVAYSERRTSDESALVVCRSIPSSGKREIVQVVSGRWGFDELVRRIVETCEINRATAAIESNAGGEFVCQAIERTRIPVVRCVTTASSKRARVEMLLSEMNASRWSFRQSPSLSDDMKKLVQELLDFDYQSHAGDRVMGLLCAVQTLRDIEAKPKRRKGGTFPFNTTRR
jgi:hypothetical protein